MASLESLCAGRRVLMKFGGYRKRWPVKILAFAVCLFICAAMIPIGTEAVPDGEKEVGQPQKWEGNTIYCTALGDSIAKGYGGKGEEDLRSYTQFIADGVSEETGIPAECEKFAKNGDRKSVV